MQLKKPRYALTKTLEFGLHILVSNRVYKSLTSRHLTATKYSFSFTSSDKFWTRLIIIYQTCFHIMTQKTTGLVELNLQWELYIFTLLFSSTGLLWLLVLWIWLKFFFIYPVSGFGCQSLEKSCIIGSIPLLPPQFILIII